MLASITACSESPDKLYGVYKIVNDERDREGYIKTLTISEDKIKFRIITHPYPTLPLIKEGDFWLAKSSNSGNIIAKFKELEPNIIECIRVSRGKEESFGKYVKITDEEFKTIQNTPIKPKPKEYPSLF